MYVESSSQAGKLSSFQNNHVWEYQGLFAVEYPTAVFLGDPAVDGGDGIQLGQWNPGMSLAEMINHGNILLNIEWDATDPSSDASICDGNTATCWDLSIADDLQIDDDSDVVDDTGSLSVINVPETPSRVAFVPTGGLDICSTMICNDALLDETLNTYFHIKPPTGLSAGDYETTLTMTLSESI